MAHTRTVTSNVFRPLSTHVRRNGVYGWRSSYGARTAFRRFSSLTCTENNFSVSKLSPNCYETTEMAFSVSQYTERRERRTDTST